jgi:ABC-type multidrug transport system permease subunit
MATLLVEDVNVHYGAAQALRGVSLRAETGRVTCVLGRNGVGKSSLLRAIMGIQPISGGSIRWADTNLAGMPPYDRARRGIGYVPQGREIFPLLTVKENLETGFAPVPAQERYVPAEIYDLFPVLADMMNRRGGERIVPPVDARLRVWYNSSLESKNYVVPGLIAVILMIIASLLTSLTIAREWEMGTMEQLLSTPLRPAEMVLGKMLAYFVVGLTDSAIAVLVGVYVFRVPFRGSVPLLVVSTCVFLMGALFWGIFISAATRTQQKAYQISLLTSFLPAQLLSGFVWSIESMPKAIQVITRVVPARYFVTILKGVFLKGVGLSVLGGELGFLALYAAIVFLLATRKLRQKLA